MVCVNPTMAQDDVVVILHFSDEESGRHGLASDSELHRSNPFSADGFASSHTVDSHGHPDLLNIGLAHLLVHGVRHHIDHDSSTNEHARN